MAFSENDLKDQLFQEIEDYKKVPKDFQNLVAAATAFRQCTLDLHLKGLAFAAELKKIGEKNPNSRWGGEFVKRAMDQENIEKIRYEWQTKIWDNFVLPMMEITESDKRDLLNAEKKLKAISQQLVVDYKQDLKKTQKAKKNTINPDGEGLKDSLKSNQEKLLNYFHIFKDIQYSKWLAALSNTLSEEKVYFNGGAQVLQGESWKSVAITVPPPLPDVDAIFTTAKPLPIPPVAVSSPVTTSNPSPSSGSINSNIGPSDSGLPVLKTGYLLKKGGNRHNWKKRWFSFDSQKIQYFENEASFITKVPALGFIPVSECKSYELQPYKKKDYILKINTPNRVYLLSHETPQELVNWSDVLKNYIKLTSISSINLDENFVPEPNSTPNSTANSTAQWERYTTDDGTPYWYNPATQESVWNNPNV